METNSHQPFDDEPEDDNSDYDNPLGRLPNGSNLPADDRPTGEFIDFATALTAINQRDEIKQRMREQAMAREYAERMKAPLAILNAMRKELADAKRKYTDAEAKADQEENSFSPKAMHAAVRQRLFQSAIEEWTCVLTLAMNQTLETLAVNAEGEMLRVGAETATWFREKKF